MVNQTSLQSQQTLAQGTQTPFTSVFTLSGFDEIYVQTLSGLTQASA